MDKGNNNLAAVILLGTLKQEGEFSHTETLSELLREELQRYDVETRIVHLADHDQDLFPGVESDMGEGDAWPRILEKVLAADIIVFATPVWWGNYSSLIQRVIERMDALNDELLETGKSELANKIGGMVVSGAEDGAEHIIGMIANFMIWNGITLPPACSLSYLGEYPESKTELMAKFKEQKSTLGMAKVMARNLVFFARLLKENPMPQEEQGIMESVAPGSTGMRGDSAEKNKARNKGR